MDFLNALDADYRRFTAAARQAGTSAMVPTCPEWKVDDLVSHLGLVYLHKAEAMRLNAHPSPWPPDLSSETPQELLRRAYAEMSDEFVSRKPESPAYTWYGPDQTVSFWIRRMAQETVIHRIDAELAAELESLPIPDDLAADGIDEILNIFLGWASSQWPEDFTEALSKGDGSVAVGDFVVSWADGRIAIGDSGPAEAGVKGTPDALLRWLWGRAQDDSVQIDGDVAKVAQFRSLLREATQ